MIIKKDTILKINHARKGIFTAIADKDFDTDITSYHPVSSWQLTEVEGAFGYYTAWRKGYEILCAKTLCSIKEILTQGRDY